VSPDPYIGRGLVGGIAEGEAVLSLRAFTFAHGVNPATGEITDVRSDARGSNVKGRALFYPYGKGSTTASSWFLETVRRGNGPVSIATESVDLAAVIGSVLAKLVYKADIPVVTGVTRDFVKSLKQGTRVRVDGDSGEVVVLG
jgi:predicted aconitase with swiveling domain